MQRKYIVLFILVIVLVPAILFLLQPKQPVIPANQPKKTLVVTLGQQAESREYIIMDQSVGTDKTENSVMSGKILREESQKDGHTWQLFVIRHSDGSERELLNTIEDGKIFEKIGPQNWAPTNRWLFVFYHDNDKRNILAFKTDGTFTNAKYYLYPTQLYPDWSILSAEWIDSETLTLQATNIKTRENKKFIVDFDDDTGNMIPEEGN